MHIADTHKHNVHACTVIQAYSHHDQFSSLFLPISSASSPRDRGLWASHEKRAADSLLCSSNNCLASHRSRCLAAPAICAMNGHTNGQNGHMHEDKPIDLSHHLSTLSKSRQSSPLKDIIRCTSLLIEVLYAGEANPPPSVRNRYVGARHDFARWWTSSCLTLPLFVAQSGSFPVRHVRGPGRSKSTCPGDAFAREEWQGQRQQHEQTTGTRAEEPALAQLSDNTLSKAMQYTAGTGDAELTKFCHNFVKTVFKPARSDFQVVLLPT